MEIKETGGRFIYVALWGSDKNPGSIGKPYKTIQHAVDNAVCGDTVYIREGMYFEKFAVVGKKEGNDFLTIKGYVSPEGIHEVPVLDGTCVHDGSDEQTMILIEDSNNIRIMGITVQNNAPYISKEGMPAGIKIVNSESNTEGMRNIEIVNCKVFNMDGETFAEVNEDGETYSFNGAGIQVVSYVGPDSTEASALTGLLIEGNEVAYCRLGWSESVAINGNVTDFKVTRNFVHNNNNIGIGIIGFESWVAAKNLRHSPLNCARNGKVYGNVCLNNDGHSNNVYEFGGGSPGIYVDGARDIEVFHNYCAGSDIGIEIGCENGITGSGTKAGATGILVRGNIAANNTQGALYLGGTDGNNKTVVRNNTFLQRDLPHDSGGVIVLMHRRDNSKWEISDNILLSMDDRPYYVGDAVFKRYVSFSGNVYYGASHAAYPDDPGFTLALDCPISNLKGDFAVKPSFEGKGACVPEVRESMGDDLFAIAIHDYVAYEEALKAAKDIYNSLNKKSMKGSTKNPLTIDKIGRNLARYLEKKARKQYPEQGVRVQMLTGEDSGIVKLGGGADGDVEYVSIAEQVDEPKILRGRFCVHVPYHFNGYTGYISREVEDYCLQVKASDGLDNRKIRFVCKNGGSDKNTGSSDKPWKSIQHAVEELHHGDTLYIREGVYDPFEIPVSASGGRGHQTRIAAYQNEEVIIRGGGKDSIIEMTDVDNIIIEGLVIENGECGIEINGSAPKNGKNVSAQNRSILSNWQPSYWQHKPKQKLNMSAGMMSGIHIVNNEIRNITSSKGGFGIMFYQRNPFAPARGVLYNGNKVWGNRLASAEAVVLNGNIDGFIVFGNHVHSNNNIGVYMAGYEEAAPMPSGAFGRFPVLPKGESAAPQGDAYKATRKKQESHLASARGVVSVCFAKPGLSLYNFVRSGKVFGNVVHGINTTNNHNYSEEWLKYGFSRCSNGIYVDGANHIDIFCNFVWDCDIGIEISSERVMYDEEGATVSHFVTTGVRLYDNIIASSSGWQSLSFGGYSIDRTKATNLEIRNNIFYNDNALSATVMMGNSEDNYIEDNIFMGYERSNKAIDALEGPDNWLAESKQVPDDIKGANCFGANIWIGPEGWAKSLGGLLTAAQLENQRILPLDTDSPLTDPASGNFDLRKIKAFKGFGTNWRKWKTKKWEFDRKVFGNLFAEYKKAYEEMKSAMNYLSGSSFSLTEAAATHDNMKEFITDKLSDAGFPNTEITYVMQEWSSEEKRWMSAFKAQQNNSRKPDTKRLTPCLDLSMETNGNNLIPYLNNISDKNGNINKEAIPGMQSENKYQLQITTRYGTNLAVWDSAETIIKA